MTQPRFALSAMSIACAATLAFGACTPNGADDEDEGTFDALSTLSTKTITTTAKFDSIAFKDDGLIVLGKSVKFLIDNRVPSKPQIYFMNANFKKAGKTPDSAKFHYFFAEEILSNFTDDLGSFNTKTYDLQKKTYMAGTIQVYKLAGQLTYGIQFYPQDVIKEQTILAAVKVVKSAFKIPSAKLAFVATGPQQTATTIDSALKALPVDNSTIEKILGALTYLPMNLGEAFGFVVSGKADDELTPLDIPIFDELPLALAVVGGTITTQFQDASSHINLKSKERGTPNMVLRDANTNPALKPFINNPDKPVHMVITVEGPQFLPTTKAEVLQRLKDRMTKPVDCGDGGPKKLSCPLKFVSATELLSYADMCHTTASKCITLQAAYGSKAANLGLLTNPKFLGTTTDASALSNASGFKYDLVPKGFGIPIQFYKTFVAHPPNQALRDAIADLIAAENSGTLSQLDRVAKVKIVQDAFYVAEMPPGMADQVKAKLAVVVTDSHKFKFRSSANAEDLPNFDGAGLYDSFTVNTEHDDNADGSCEIVQDEGSDVETKLKVSPNSVQCGMKAVFASVWNKRAIEERSFGRLDHATAGMGIAVVPKYDTESPVAANAVVVTRVIGSTGVFGYTISSQTDNNLVTNPAPGTLSESTIAAFITQNPTDAGSFVVTRFATPVKDQPPLTIKVLTDAQLAQMVRITKTVETAYCRTKPDYYDEDCTFVTVDRHKAKSLDFELKLLENGHFVVKQVREWAGR